MKFSTQTTNVILLISFIGLAGAFIALAYAPSILINIHEGKLCSFCSDIVTYIKGKPLSVYPIEKFFLHVKKFAIGLIAIFISAVSLILFFLYTSENSTKKSCLITIILIILNGLAIRILLAVYCFGNWDMHAYADIADIMQTDKDLYSGYRMYPHTPIWAILLGWISDIEFQIDFLPFHALVKIFLTGIDLASLLVLLAIAQQKQLSKVRTALLFFLNPISFLITGYHGQFNNLPILMLLIGLCFYLYLKNYPILARIILWLSITVGTMAKHVIFYEVLICLNTVKRLWVQFALFGLSVLLFFASFGTYLIGDFEGIVKYVLSYGDSKWDPYGIGSVTTFPLVKYIFIIILFLFPFYIRGQDLLKQCLLGILFFLTFTTGIGPHYFMLPLALGALRPSMGFLLYSLAGTLFLLGLQGNIDFILFQWNHGSYFGIGYFQWNLMWLASVYWFLSELYQIRFEAQSNLRRIRLDLQYKQE